MKPKTETTAQEALRLLKPVPAKQWCTGFFNDGQGRCCGIGHWYRLKAKGGSYDFTNMDVDMTVDSQLRKPSALFIEKKYKVNRDIADVNNQPTVNNYTQKSIKARVIALLKDMVKAGF